RIRTIEIDLVVPYELDRDAVVRAAEDIKAATNLQIVSINTLVVEPRTQNEAERVRLFPDLPLYASKQGTIYGKPFRSKPVSMRGLNEEDGRVTVWGDVFGINERTTKDGRRNIIDFSITDYDGSFKVKIFDDCSQCANLLKNLKNGSSVMVRGDVEYDKYLRALVIKAIGVTLVEKEKREDKAEHKRVELHLHTNMSAHDGLSSATDLIKRAHSWGHKAVAITDHGVVQAFPEAAKAAGAIAKSDPENKIKILYGMEGYLVDDSDGDEEAYKNKANHIVLIAQNEVGRKNLYKLVSKSHTQYFYRTPRIPKSELMAHRDGLLLGSACEAGEVYRAVLANVNQEELEKIASLYDYFEIMPKGNNRFMLNSGMVSSEEELEEINKKIIALAEKVGKLAVATGDVHFLDEKNDASREVMMVAKGFADASDQPPLYFMTTDEMLEEFSYLGEEKALEVVVTNTNKIANMVEDILPIIKGTYPPEIEGSDRQLREICYKRTEALYGNPIPEYVKERLEKELDSIIKNGFSVLYVIAQKLVDFSVENGYLVGSRGSVGSSFVAFAAGISEVNPLVPHYLCPNCCHSEFFMEGEYGSGYDMPPKDCPHCRTKMVREGHDIPFETFLGFKGEKQPDIDLNFSGEFQEKAHRFTEEIFGKDNCFKAGTIGTIAEKTAFGYVKKFLEESAEHGIDVSSVTPVEQERLAAGMVGVKRTTGQHPGGMVVIPSHMEIEDFTPVQYPADDQKKAQKTTHFDYRALEDTIFKLDILGHDVPTLLKMLEDETGVGIKGIDICDPKLYELILSPKPMGVTEEDIFFDTGTLSIPEMGTSFVCQMLVEAKPKRFSELIQISGLSHGEGVWLGNAQDLIANGTCTIAEVIGTRDSIMTYLIRKGVRPGVAFEIMEIVRKGKSKILLTQEHIDEMKANDVPDWYIESCKKINYMFPKAHAAAYIIGALRLAWYKIYRPLEYYAVYLGVKGEDVDAKAMVEGPAAVRSLVQNLMSLPKQEISKKQEATLSIMLIANEMMARGIEVLPVDINLSEERKYTIENGKLRLPFSTVEGAGANAAAALRAARDDGGGAFLSVDDFKRRAKASSTIMTALENMGAFEDIPKSTQLNLFDF
ncbi:MAG TPA: PolC-type DNA polymerase III, partial [Oscillospiraceae bacterium]|nr:PolC-type DNA polymerase III [Oscillospiraceae bacterium]